MTVPACRKCHRLLTRIDAHFIRPIKQVDGKWALDELDYITYSCPWCGNPMSYDKEPMVSILKETDG